MRGNGTRKHELSTQFVVDGGGAATATVTASTIIVIVCQHAIIVFCYLNYAF